MQPCAHITNKILEAQGFGTYCYVFYFRNNKVLLNVQLNVWAECMNRQCSCNTVTVACAVPTNSLCKVNEWYQHDCVTRSGILYRTGDTATVSYTGMTITEGRTQTKQTRWDKLSAKHLILATLSVHLTPYKQHSLQLLHRVFSIHL